MEKEETVGERYSWEVETVCSGRYGRKEDTPGEDTVGRRTVRNKKESAEETEETEEGRSALTNRSSHEGRVGR